MTGTNTRSRAAGVLAAAVLAACAGALPAAAQTHTHGGHTHGTGTIAAPADRWTEADARFMSAMIGHHAQAVQMARLAPGRAGGNSVRILAERIISAQEDEIATMQQWLRDRGQPVPDAHDAGAHHGGHGSPMPGMVTPEQMARLEQASGPEFDRLFLSYMIQHHQGAVSMVRELFGSYGAGQDEAVFKFASDVNVDQETEIARMRGMLADLMFQSPAP